MGATRQTGGWRRPRASRRRASTGRAGGPLAADGGVAKAGAHVREIHESSREFTRDCVRKFSVHDSRRVAAGNWRRGRRRVRACPRGPGRCRWTVFRWRGAGGRVCVCRRGRRLTRPCRRASATAMLCRWGRGRYSSRRTDRGRCRGRGGWGGVQPKMGVSFRQSMVRWQDWEIHEGHEGARRVGRALRRELMGVHSCPDCDLCDSCDLCS